MGEWENGRMGVEACGSIRGKGLRFEGHMLNSAGHFGEVFTTCGYVLKVINTTPPVSTPTLYIQTLLPSTISSSSRPSSLPLFHLHHKSPFIHLNPPQTVTHLRHLSSTFINEHTRPLALGLVKQRT